MTSSNWRSFFKKFERLWMYYHSEETRKTEKVSFEEIFQATKARLIEELGSVTVIKGHAEDYLEPQDSKWVYKGVEIPTTSSFSGTAGEAIKWDDEDKP